MRPFGTDDDDIELNYILDRNVEASFFMADSIVHQEPTLTSEWIVKWNDTVNTTFASKIPHTVLSSKVPVK